MGLFKKIVKGVLTGGASLVAEKAKKSKFAKAVLSVGASVLVDKLKNKKSVPKSYSFLKSEQQKIESTKTGGFSPVSLSQLGSVSKFSDLSLEGIEKQTIDNKGFTAGTNIQENPDNRYLYIGAGVLVVLLAFFLLKR